MRKLILLPMMVLLQTTAGFGQTDVRGITIKQEGLKVIDEKCLVCHNRQRIEDSARERKNMEAIQRIMEQRGAVLTEQERKVLGHFWQQNPFRSGEQHPVSH